MILDIPDDLLYIIFLSLTNQDIFNLNKICKNFKLLTNDKIFINDIWIRYQPLTFNRIDNYCKYCNLTKYDIITNLKYQHCNH